MAAPVTALSPELRWRPTRAGLVGLWRYWDETFLFHKGRLLLRGPNGSGKSMALELLLPFLLDGDTSPAKLTSAAKPRGRLFDRVMTGSNEPSRVGFAWVEFGRGAKVFTVGARVRASHATARAEVDYFTTSLSVGRDLHLLDGNRRPLSRKELAEVIGESGRIHPSAEEHRSAVRENLFPGFGASRYHSVIGALLSLRREKLSQNLDLPKLSEVLSEALPPLDDHDVAAVAEGFERLDRRKAELLVLERDRSEVRQLARLQRDYAHAILSSSAADVRAAETRRDDVTRAERQAREALERAQHQTAAVVRERGEIEGRDGAIKVELDALKDSAAYREGAALDDLRQQAGRLRQLADRATARAEGRGQEHERDLHELYETEGAEQTAAANLATATAGLHHAAEESAAGAVLAEAEALGDPDDAERLLYGFARVQRTRIGEVRAALGAHQEVLRRRGFLDEQFAGDEQAVEKRRSVHEAAVTAGADAVAAYSAAVDAWAQGSAHLGPARLAAALRRPVEEPAAVSTAVGAVLAEVRAEEAVARQHLGDQRRGLGEGQAGLRAERARWEGGELQDPEGPPWRSDRAGRRGAPLWRLVDVAPGVDDGSVDGIEAALAGAGLLDAWVNPEGGVELEEGRADVELTRRPLAQRTLAAVLAPAPEAASAYRVPGAVVAEVLASVRVGPAEAEAETEVVLNTDGTYRLGSAVGRGQLRPATFLGALARERRRLARLAEIDARLAEIDARLAEIALAEADLDRRRAAADAEVAAQPSGEAVDAATEAVAVAEARLDQARERLEATRAQRRAAQEELRQVLRDLTVLAARHGLPTENQALADCEDSLRRLSEAAGAWARRRREQLAAARSTVRATARARTSGEAATQAAGEAADVEREAAETERRVATLESSIGAEYAEVLGRIGSLEDERRAGQRRSRELATESERLQRQLGELEAKLAVASTERAEAEAHRERWQGRFVAGLESFAADAGIQLPGQTETTTGVLAAARVIAADDGAVYDPQSISRLNERVVERVHAAQTALGARVDFDRMLTGEDWWVLRTVANGIRRTVGDLAAALATELAEGRAELAEEEQRLFEQTLAGSVRRALADRIRQANALTDAINEQLTAIRSAVGAVQVRLRWEVDPDQPDAVRAARSLLLRDPADLSEAERSSLQEFVRARVDQARAELEANAPWEARLRETLDYRAWHRFSLLLAHRDWEGFVEATPRRLQKLSTGERSIALHLPMIASVAAHYVGEDGQPSGCPRLILLDELFAGVDTANRAQLFGSFSQWDLDAVFTSDHEWCQYDTLDGIAIHHLHPPVGDEPVTSTRFTWDGRRRRIDPPAA